MSSVIVSAQGTTGKLIGTVSDASGSVAGATVVITDNQTKRERTLTAGSDGSFSVSQIEFGTYTVKVTAAGFKTYTATDLKIDAGREYALNVKLEIGEVTEEVTVTAGADQINTTNAELSTVITQEQIRELPLNTRNPLGLLNLIAGGNPTTNSINGQRSSSTDYRRDGLNVQDNFIRTGGFVQDQPTVDDISEFGVTTQNSGVEQGGGSSYVSLTTPRGGSKYHGGLWIFNRNSEFAANSFVNNESRIERPFLNRNQFGVSLSGPLPFPNFGENDGPLFTNKKAFFFFNYEGFRLAQQVTASGTTMLPQARNGLYTYSETQIVNGQPVVTTQTVNVLTGVGGTRNFVTAPNAAQGGALVIDPIIQARILNNLPTSGNGPTTGTNFLQSVRFLRSDPLDRNSFTSRVDYDFSDRATFNAVYRRNNQADARTDTAAGFSPVPFVFQGGPTNFFAAGFRYSPTSSFSNEIRGGFQYSEPFFQESNVPSDFLISVPLVTNPQGSFRSQGRKTDYRNIQDNAVYTFGNHSLRFGGQFESYRIVSTNAGSTNFGGITTGYTISTTANTKTPGLTATQVCGSTNCINATDLSNMNALRYLLGGVVGAAGRTANLISTSEGYGFVPDTQEVNYEILSGYVSDQWRAKSNLTLNFGLRYQYYTPLTTPQLRYVEPDFTSGDIAASIKNPNGQLNIIGTNSGKPGRYTKPDLNNFSPNFSFAYSPNFKDGITGSLLRGTTIRGGFGISYVNDEYVKSPLTLTAGNRGLGAQNLVARDVDGLTTLKSSLSNIIADYNPVPVFNSAPAAPALPITYTQYRALGSTSTQLFGIDPKIQLGKVYEWNIGIAREIGWKSVLEIRYVGNTSNDLVRTTDFNEIDIINNGFLEDFKRAQSNLAIYDAQHRACVAGGGTSQQCTTNLGPRSARFNSGFAGSQQLPVLTQTAGGGNTLLNNATFLTQFEQGGAGAAAQLLITNNLTGSVKFQDNPHILISEIIQNVGIQNYHALQAEVRRRFSSGVSFQANYTFQKTLTDIPDDSQNRQGELQDSGNPRLNYGRPDYDRTHTVNANMIYELPFGRGKTFLNQGGWVDKVFGGFQVSSIVNLSSGAPLAIIDPRGTSSIAFKSGRQSASSSLSTSEIKKLTGVFDTPNGRYFIDPKVLFATIRNPVTGVIQSGFDLYQTMPAGFVLDSVRGASPIGTAPFAGQVFFFNKAGEVGNLPRNFMNGLPYINWDAGLSKSVKFGETMRLQLRMEAFNVLNSQKPGFSADLNVASTSFGRITSTNVAPRVLQFGARFDF